MPKLNITVRLYVADVVGASVTHVLEKVAKKTPEQRNMDTSAGGYIRLENLKQQDGICLMDFAVSRSSSGSVKISKQKIDPHHYNRDQLPGEEVAALYVPATGHFLVQSGHIKAHHMFEYIKKISAGKIPSDAEIGPVPNLEKLGEFNKTKRIRKLILSVKPPVLANSQALNSNDSMKRALMLGRGINAGQMNLEFLAPKAGNILGLGADVVDIAKTVFKAFWKNLDQEQAQDEQEPSQEEQEQAQDIQHAISKMQVSFTDSDHKTVNLDLLHLLIEEKFAVQESESERRVPQQERYAALLKAYALWKHLLSPE